MNYKNFHPQVRDICAKYGWTVLNTYNDKRKDGSRRLSYCRNGSSLGPAAKRTILSRVRGLTECENMNANVYWYKATRGGYGTYDKLCVVVAD
jgi:hypothetical protein